MSAFDRVYMRSARQLVSVKSLQAHDQHGNEHERRTLSAIPTSSSTMLPACFAPAWTEPTPFVGRSAIIRHDTTMRPIPCHFTALRLCRLAVSLKLSA